MLTKLFYCIEFQTYCSGAIQIIFTQSKENQGRQVSLCIHLGIGNASRQLFRATKIRLHQNERVRLINTTWYSKLLECLFKFDLNRINNVLADFNKLSVFVFCALLPRCQTECSTDVVYLVMASALMQPTLSVVLYFSPSPTNGYPPQGSH